jgi:hypothetical protein
VAIVGGAVGLLGSVTGRLPSIIAAMFYPTAVGVPSGNGGSSEASSILNSAYGFGVENALTGGAPSLRGLVGAVSNAWNWVSQHTNGWV